MLTTTSSTTDYQNYTNNTITAASTTGVSTTLKYNDIYSTGTGNYVWTTSTNWESLEDQIKRIVKDEINEKEKDKTMDFNFGPYNSNSIRLSIYGIAIKNKAGKWVSYNKDTQKLMDVEVLNIDIDSSKYFINFQKQQILLKQEILLSIIANLSLSKRCAKMVSLK